VSPVPHVSPAARGVLHPAQTMQSACAIPFCATTAGLSSFPTRSPQKEHSSAKDCTLGVSASELLTDSLTSVVDIPDVYVGSMSWPPHFFLFFVVVFEGCVCVVRVKTKISQRKHGAKKRER
jgi:hypothetical protein